MKLFLGGGGQLFERLCAVGTDSTLVEDLVESSTIRKLFHLDNGDGKRLHLSRPTDPAESEPEFTGLDVGIRIGSTPVDFSVFVVFPCLLVLDGTGIRHSLCHLHEGGVVGLHPGRLLVQGHSGEGVANLIGGNVGFLPPLIL